MRKKIVLYFLMMSFLSVFSVYGQEKVSQDFEIAEKLFQNKKYTDAYQLYADIFTKNEQYSPQMLLKMAYIQEGLEQYPEALYYLNLYYNQNPSKKVLAKMEILADAQKYEGYKIDDSRYFATLYKQYQNYIIAILFVLFGAVVGLLFRRKSQNRHFLYPAILLVAILAFGSYQYNYKGQEEQVIIKDDHVYLMSSASAGSEVQTTIDKGHRLEVIDKQDIWYQIKWNDKKAYIRDYHLLQIR
jgi:hypothetical protein